MIVTQAKPLDFNDTSQLQQFINVDFDQINKERERHLKQALTSTLKERRSEMQQCEMTMKRQQEKVDQKQNEILAMQEKLSNMQKEIKMQKNQILSEKSKLEQLKPPSIDKEILISLNAKVQTKRKELDQTINKQ